MDKLNKIKNKSVTRTKMIKRLSSFHAEFAEIGKEMHVCRKKVSATIVSNDKKITT